MCEIDRNRATPLLCFFLLEKKALKSNPYVECVGGLLVLCTVVSQ
jgi:hypothetical protein